MVRYRVSPLSSPFPPFLITFPWTSFIFLFFTAKFCFFRIFSLDCSSQPFPSSLSSPPLLFSLLPSFSLALSPHSPSLCLCFSSFYSFSWTQMLYLPRWCSDSNAISVFMKVLMDFKIKDGSLSRLNYTLISLAAIRTTFQGINRWNPVKCSYFPSMSHKTNAKKCCIQVFVKGEMCQCSTKSWQG